MQRRIYRLRFLNASNARSYTLRLGNGRRCSQIAGDGGLLERPVARRSFPLHPAERIDLLIDFRDFRPGSEIVLQNTDGDSGGTVAIMRFDVVDGGGGEEARMPRGRMRTLEKLPTPNASRRWDLALAQPACSGRSTPTAASTRTGSTSRRGSAPRSCWQLASTTSNRVHPMHLHGMLFRVCRALERASSTRATGGWKDTVGVLPGETVTVQPWFIPYGGPLRVPLPLARARRQGDDAAAGGAVVRRVVAARRRGAAGVPGRRRGRE